MSEQEDADDPDRLFAMAAHEAGHFVMAVALGYTSASSTMHPPCTTVPDEQVHHVPLIAAGGVAGATLAELQYPEDGQEWDVVNAEAALGKALTFEEWQVLVGEAMSAISAPRYLEMLHTAIRLLTESGKVAAEDVAALGSGSETANPYAPLLPWPEDIPNHRPRPCPPTP